MVLTKVIRCVRFAVPVAALSLALGGVVQADVLTGTGDAYSVNVTAGYKLPILPPASISTGNIAPATYTAPPSGNNSNSLANFNLNVSPVLDLSTSLLNNAVTSTVTGGAGPQATIAVSTLSSSSLSVLDSILLPPALSITFDALSQTATASGDYGAMSATSALSIENLSIKLGGIELYAFTGVLSGELNLASINANISDSLALAGISLILNQQTFDTSNPNGLGISSNAIALSVNADVLGLASLNGDVTIGHAAAFQSYGPNAVPEPASVALLGLGVLGAGAVGFRKRATA